MAPGSRFVTEVLDYDGGRAVTAYVPPSSPEAIIFAGDGEPIPSWADALEGTDAPPTMIVGAHALADEILRIHEYSPGQSTAEFAFDPQRFASHERFFVDDVRGWVASRFGVELPPERTAVCGVSASAELALAMGLRHPDVYGVVMAASPGAGFRPQLPLPDRLPRSYLVAGKQEQFFHDNAIRWADALAAASADVVMAERDGRHGDPFWKAEFPLVVEWAFGLT